MTRINLITPWRTHDTHDTHDILTSHNTFGAVPFQARTPRFSDDVFHILQWAGLSNSEYLLALDLGRRLPIRRFELTDFYLGSGFFISDTESAFYSETKKFDRGYAECVRPKPEVMAWAAAKLGARRLFKGS